jgi:hypothetical protein
VRDDAPDRERSADALASVRDAALERAFVEEAMADRYFALAGTVEAARSDDPSTTGPFHATLFALTTLRALDHAAESDDAWAPDPTRDAYDRAVVDGAVLAAREFDLPPSDVAALAGVPAAALAARLD